MRFWFLGLAEGKRNPSVQLGCPFRGALGSYPSCPRVPHGRANARCCAGLSLALMGFHVISPAK